jgi:hypothetical protein
MNKHDLDDYDNDDDGSRETCTAWGIFIVAWILFSYCVNKGWLL